MGRARRPLQGDARVSVTKFARRRPPLCTLCEQRAGAAASDSGRPACAAGAHLVPLPAVALPEAGGEVVEELREGAALLRTRAPPTRRPAGTGCQQVMRSAALLRRQPAGAASARTLMFS